MRNHRHRGHFDRTGRSTLKTTQRDETPVTHREDIGHAGPGVGDQTGDEDATVPESVAQSPGEELDDDVAPRRIREDAEGLHGRESKSVRKLVNAKISDDENTRVLGTSSNRVTRVPEPSPGTFRSRPCHSRRDTMRER